MYWIDCHIHLSSFSSDSIRTLIEKSKIKQIQSWILAGYDSQDWQKQIKISESHIQRSFGLHPWQVLAFTDLQVQQELDLLAQMLPQCDWLGETGVDGFRAKSKDDLFKQMEVFEKHLELNKLYEKPLVLHIVKSHDLALELLKKYNYRGMVHGFSGSWETAQKYIKLGYKISIGRGIYQKGYRALKEAALKLDVQDILIESDAYNDPQVGADDALEIYFQVVREVCKIKQIHQQQLQDAVFRNIQSLTNKE
jgi:TatD DNase family protein